MLTAFVTNSRLSSFYVIGNRLFILFAYSAAVASASVSSDWDDDECHQHFCDKVWCACAFMWFTFAALLFGTLIQEALMMDA